MTGRDLSLHASRGQVATCPYIRGLFSQDRSRPVPTYVDCFPGTGRDLSLHTWIVFPGQVATCPYIRDFFPGQVATCPYIRGLFSQDRSRPVPTYVEVLPRDRSRPVPTYVDCFPGTGRDLSLHTWIVFPGQVATCPYIRGLFSRDRSRPVPTYVDCFPGTGRDLSLHTWIVFPGQVATCPYFCTFAPACRQAGFVFL